MKIDHTKRRAFLAFCMDGLARALSDEDAIGPWLADGMPDGTFDEVPEDACEKAAEPYKDYVEDMTDEEWNNLCSCWLFTMMRGCFARFRAGDDLVYESGSLS